MKTKLLITLLLAVSLLSACSETNPHPMDMSQAMQNAASKAVHEVLVQVTDKESHARLALAKEIPMHEDFNSYKAINR